MTHQPISLHEIDFSQPDREFIYKGQTYQIKEYSDICYVKKNKSHPWEFIYVFCSHSASLINKQNYSSTLEEIILKKADKLLRCVEYENIIFGFSTNNKGCYFSIEDEYWTWFNWKAPRHMSIDDLLEKPYDFFIDKAKTIYYTEIPLIEDKVDDYSYRSNTAKPIEFVCGSESELERLTQLAAFILPEFKPLFERYSSFKVIYESENAYQCGGITEEIDTPDWYYDIVLSKQAQKLFDLIFEYNYFTGLQWEYNDGHGYTGYDPLSYTIEISLQAPSQHERLEAVLELQSWLEGKLPDEEIRAYFE